MHVRVSIAALLIAAAMSVQAADMQIAPTRLFFAPDERVKDITIGNPGERPLLVELQAFHWKTQSRVPADDVIISPPIAQIPAGESAVIRVGFRGSSSGRCEATYRLWVTEVPQKTAQGLPVQMRTRMDLPIFRANERGCEPRLLAAWDPVNRQLNINNEGTAHTLVQELLLRYAGGEVAVPVPTLGYVLPGSSRDFRVPADAGLDASSWLELVAQTPGETVNLIIKPRP